MLFRPACGGLWAALVALCLGACSPTLDWREVRPEGSGALAMFPCKPSTDARMVSLAGVRLRMVLASCRAGDATYALAFADAAEPARVGPALEALRAASVANLRAAAQVLGPMKVDGMTPNRQAERVRFNGKFPNGDTVTQEAGFFAKGTWVYQATAMGQRVDAEPVETFFAGLKLPT